MARGVRRKSGASTGCLGLPRWSSTGRHLSRTIMNGTTAQAKGPGQNTKERVPMAKEINRGGVVGWRGSGMAKTCAQWGYERIVHEVNQDLLDKGLKRIHGAWEMLVGKKKLSEDQAQEARNRLRGTLSLEDFRDCDLLVEAIVE